MIAKDKIIKLTNRDTGFVGYSIPDMGLHRRFTPGETKEVTFEEIEKLSWAPGGKEMLRDFLIIADEEAANEILGHVEPEYFYTKDNVHTLLAEGTLEQLQDTLDFAPKGVIDLVKQEAVEMKLDSSIKRQEIQKATNFNVTNAIELGVNEPAEDEALAATSSRRAKPVTASETKSATSGRRYKIID
jgi:hypothetical protein